MTTEEERRLRRNERARARYQLRKELNPEKFLEEQNQRIARRRSQLETDEEARARRREYQRELMRARRAAARKKK